MASAIESVERFEKEGVFPASARLTARRLRENAPDFWAGGTKGGGWYQPQVQPWHLTNFILANASHLPTDAGEAVAALRDLPMTGLEILTRKQPGPPADPAPLDFLTVPSGDSAPLGARLDHVITACADPALRARALAAMTGQQWQLTLCAEPPYATVSYRMGNEIWIETYGASPSRERGARLVALHYRFLRIAGVLLEDSLERSGNPARSALPTEPSSHRAREAEKVMGSLNSPDPTLRARARNARR